MPSRDWNAPFDISLLQSGEQFLVRCVSTNDAERFVAMIDGSSERLRRWVEEGARCFRFAEDGHAIGRFEHEEIYDHQLVFRRLSRFTFYPDAVNLPDFDTSNPATLL